MEKNSPTVMIGINDCGKSTILKAVGLLLDPKSSFGVMNVGKTTSDISNTIASTSEYAEVFSSFNCPVQSDFIKSTVIIGEFVQDSESEYANIDLTQTSDQMKWAIESQQRVLILRMFNNENPDGRYYICLGDSTELLELWKKGDKDLQELRKLYEIQDEDIENQNQKGRFSGIEKIRALYKKTGHAPVWAEAPTFLKEDIRLLPTYQYIDWNTSLSEINKIANNVMRDKIEPQKASLIQQAIDLSTAATTEVNAELKEITKELMIDLPSISGIKAQVSFAISESISDMIINKTTSDGDVRLESQGEGIKRQIIFSFLKWASKQKIKEIGKSYIWCFDEPESHLYPAAQRELVRIIKLLASANYQVAIGTHSTIFVDRTRLADLKRIIIEEKYSKILSCESVDDVHSLLGVKNSDILFFNKFLLAEGECEEILIPHLYKIFFGRSIEEDGRKFVYLGGSGQYENNKKIFAKIMSDYGCVDSLTHYIVDADTLLSGENVSTLGTCDMEDALPDTMWIRLLSDHCGLKWNEARLNSIRGKIDINDKNKKFHKLLVDEVAADKCRTNFLPGKKDCAALMRGYMMSIDQIPKEIQDIFSKHLVVI